jgi:OPA family glycerol-3-phosphate transporter-like MFS transporter
MGQIASLGVIFYAVGKVINGVIGDLVGGKKIFLLGMAGSVLATVLFGLGAGVAVFFPAWALNRAVQSMGWGGLVKVTAGWFSYRSYGKIMALLSLSFLFGDVVAKLLLGSLIDHGLDWRELFYVSAAVLAVIAVLDVFLVKESPERLGLPAPPVNPDNLFTERGADERARGLRELLLPYFRSLSFRLVLAMSFGLTAIREAFNFWVPTYLHEVAGMSEAAASGFSSLYPVFGMVSILAAGYLSDTVARGRAGRGDPAGPVAPDGHPRPDGGGPLGPVAAAGVHFTGRPAAAGAVLLPGGGHVAGRGGPQGRGYRRGPGGCGWLRGRHAVAVAHRPAGPTRRLEQRLRGAGPLLRRHGRGGGDVLLDAGAGEIMTNYQWRGR